MLSYEPTPIQEICSKSLEAHGIKFLVKREDLNHRYVSGNKWWKLKYNLAEAKKLGHSKLLTFGGAYSNHIYATAAAAQEQGFESIGVIRGDELLPLNHTLTFAESCGMKLHFVSREAYIKKTEKEFVENLNHHFGDFYLIPEGGSNALAVKGCIEFGQSLLNEVAFDYACLPIGTAATMAGIIEGGVGLKKIVGFSVLKGGGFLREEIKNYLSSYTTQVRHNWNIVTDFHFGGYGKTTAALLAFKKSFEQEYQIPLDQVYTAKMMAGIFDLIGKEYFERGSTLLAIHTGGLQGNYPVI